eukprot:XP_001709943.1 Hypothetical protein GL50803_106010 [Giardia lamblia ATCC 50803]
MAEAVAGDGLHYVFVVSVPPIPMVKGHEHFNTWCIWRELN